MVPEGLKIYYLEVPDLPANWQDIPAPPVLAESGDAWFKGGSTAILAVPSW